MMLLNQNKPRIFGLTQHDKEDRPEIRPEMTPVDWMLEAFALAGLVVTFGYLAHFYPRLPEIIPTHFNAVGQADDTGPRSTALIMPFISVFIYALLTIVSRFPHRFNFAVAINAKNAMRQYTFALRLIRSLKVIIMWLFFFIIQGIVRSALGGTEGLGLWFLPVFLAFTFVPLIVYLVFSFRNR